MGHFIERLAEIKQDSVRLPTFVKRGSKVINGEYKLGFTRAFFAEAMLGRDQDVVSIKMGCHTTANYVLEEFAYYRCEGYGAVVGSGTSIAFFKHGLNKGVTPGIWYFASFQGKGEEVG